MSSRDLESSPAFYEKESLLVEGGSLLAVVESPMLCSFFAKVNVIVLRFSCWDERYPSSVRKYTTEYRRNSKDYPNNDQSDRDEDGHGNDRYEGSLIQRTVCSYSQWVK